MPQARHRASPTKPAITTTLLGSALFGGSLLFIASLMFYPQISPSNATAMPIVDKPVPAALPYGPFVVTQTLPTTQATPTTTKRQSAPSLSTATTTPLEKDQAPYEPSTPLKTTTESLPTSPLIEEPAREVVPLPPLPKPLGSNSFGGVAEHVALVGNFLQAEFNITTVGGLQARPNNPTSDHPKGLALDFVVSNSQGDALAACANSREEDWNITYVLWQVPDHYDHVHISFSPTGTPTNLICN